MASKRQQRIVGAVVKIPLDEKHHTYGQILPEADVAVFDSRSVHDLSPVEVISTPVLFRVAVYNHAITKGRWPKIGSAPLRDEFQKPATKFIQDPLKPTEFSIYCGGETRRASRAECKGLELAAVWEPEHVEDRIRDHYRGAPNKWVQSLGIR